MVASDPNPSAPTLETARLVMRGHQTSDLGEVCKLWADPRVTRYIGKPQTEEESWGRLLRYAGHWALLGFGYWAIEEKATHRFVGEAGFADYRRVLVPPLGDTPELGWVISPEMAGQGYATEAAMAALAWGRKQWPARRVACIINPEHHASLNVATKCGFERTGESEYKGSRIAIFDQWLPATP